MTETPAELTPEQKIAMDDFANLSKAMSTKMEQHNQLAERRRAAARTLRDLGVPATAMAKTAGVSVQAVYKLLQQAE